MSRTVLLIEHDARRVAAFQRLLTEAGCRVVVAKESLEALEVFQRLRPNLVMIEAAPPEMQGFELCRALKETPQGRGTPVIIAATTQKGESYRAQALDRYGCDEFLETPLSDRRLIESCLRLLDNSIPASTGERPQGSSLASLAPGESLVDEEALDQALGSFDSLFEDIPPVSATPPRQSGDRFDESGSRGAGRSAAPPAARAPISRSEMHPFTETLEELSRVADELVDRLPFEETTPEPSLPSQHASVERTIESLQESLEELTRAEAGLEPEAPRSPEVVVGGDRGEDIGDHLDSLFAGKAEADTPPVASKPVRSTPSAAPAGLGATQGSRKRLPAVAPSAAPAGLGAGQAGRKRPPVAPTHAAPPAAPRPKTHAAPPTAPQSKTHAAPPPAPQPKAQEFVVPSQGSTRGALPQEGRGRIGLGTFVAALALLLLGAGLWLMRPTWEKREQASIEVREEALDTLPVQDASTPPESASEPTNADAGMSPEPSPLESSSTKAPPSDELAATPDPRRASADSVPLSTAITKPLPAPQPSSGSAPVRTAAEPKVLRPVKKPLETNRVVRPGPAAAPSAPELHTAEPALPPPATDRVETTSVAPPNASEIEPPSEPAPHPDAQAVISPYQPPVVLQRVEPSYPPRALKRGDHGTVVLKVLVNEGGKVVRVVVEQGMAGSELEAAAIDAVLRWDYHPATENGHTIRAWTTEKFVFAPPSQTER